MTQMNTQKRHLIILITLFAALLGWNGKAWAVDWTGNVAAQNITANTTVNVTGTVNLQGTITVKSGYTLTIQPSNSANNRTIRRRGNWNGNMFYVEDGATLTIKNRTVNGTIYYLVFNGGATYTNGDARTGAPTANYGTGNIIQANGNLTIAAGTYLQYSHDGSAISCSNTSSTARTFNLNGTAANPVTIRGCRQVDSGGSAIYFHSSDNHTANLTNVNIYYCQCVNEGGTIRTNGAVKTVLTISGGKIYSNDGGTNGGGIYWNAAGATATKVELKDSAEISGNSVSGSGGGIFIESRMTLTSATIKNNTAVNGGGIYFCTYGGGAANFDGKPFNATIGSGVTISGNHATSAGGGLYLSINKSPDIGYNTSGAAMDVEYKLIVNGGTITGNHAPLGGGVAIHDIAPNKVKYRTWKVAHTTNYTQTGETISGQYRRNISISSGSIYDNYTDGGSQYGAGMYIYKGTDSDIVNGTTLYQTISGTNYVYCGGFKYNTSGIGGAGTMSVSISGGNIYHNGLNGSTVNTKYGGAFFITDEMGNVSPYLSQCNVSVSGGSIYQNQCTTNGGAIYLNNAVFTMSAGTIGGSTANANKATGGSGGGFFITGAYSKVTVSGGNITYNTATSGNGGGFYVANSSSDGTTISGSAQVKYNQAKNGAGAFINAGKLTINGSGVAVSNNTASASGGGVYVNGGTVGVTSATIGSNTAATHGGGIYSASGAVTLSSATLSSNTATGGNGGGVYAANSVTVTSSTLTGNIATNGTNGMGGGIYATGNSTTVSISGTSSAKSLLTSNQARLGGGVYAAAQSVTIGYATIGNSGARNTATADGGGLYVAGPVTLNTGAVIQCNTASNDGGGVYVNNGTFTMNTGTIGGSSATYANIATNGNGGGVYVTGGSAKVQVLGGSINYNSAPSTTSGKGNGGGIYVASSHSEGTSISGGATVSYNTAKQNGGGIYVVSGKVTLEGTSSSTPTSVTNNTAETTNGGGVYLGGGEFILGACSKIATNHADNGNGGGVCVGGTSPIYRQNGDSYSLVEYNTADNGAGLYMGGGTCYLSAGYIHANTADVNGGGIYMNGGTFQHSAGEIGNQYSAPNQAVNGGGLYVNGGDYYSTNSAAWINGNKATSNGGGIYMNGGNCYMQGGHLGYNGASQLNSAVNGAGLYMAGTGHFEMTSSSSEIRGNHASGNGGGIYMEGGTCDVTAGNIGVSGAANQAVNGGGIYANGGTITVNGGNIIYNTATNAAGGVGDGGGIYSNAGTVTVSSGNITNNTALANGGGIYAKGTVGFSNGSISSNTATNANGGGVYIYSTGRLNVSGTAEISANHVPNGWGGGVYQGGTMYADGSSLNVSGNSKGRDKNNVYLPDGQTIEVGPNISTSVNLGIFTENIATVGNDIPVLTTVENGSNNKLPAIYNAMLTGTSNIRDDRNMHQPIYTGADATGHTLYFGFIEFDYPAYTSNFENPIDSRAKLYQFMCWVNGLNGYGATHPGETGNVTADIEADFNLWVPIGEANIIGETEPYTGTFNGNGHVISDLKITNELYSNYGLFGTTEGAAIDGIYVNNFELEKNTAGAIGCIVGHMQGGSLTNSTCSGILTAAHADCIAGGLVGKFEKNGSASGTIHSCYAGTNQTGYQMGGLVGDLAAGCSLYNSYANASFSPQSGSTKYMGGLVGINKGTVENCYSRVRGTIPSATYFGWLAGDNTNGSLVSSYIPTSASTRYTATGKTGTQTSLNNYDPVIAPYLYYTTGDNAVGNSTLMALLNSWVSNHSGYATWRRTKAGGTAYSATAGDINGDYPVHQYDNTNCVAASGVNALSIDYTATLNDMLTRHTSNATINLYEHDVTNMATGNGVVVYIDEDISLLQTDATKDIEAYTCQTLPGSPRSWHFLSSSLENSGIGFNYSHDAAFNWSPDPCGLTFSSDDDHALFPSDMPAVDKMDLYCFYEPEYHWINFKRNSNSHWHMNANTVPIYYTNETDLVPGKGYLVSIDKDQLLQNRGTLNNGNVPITLDFSPHQAWAGLVGYNLIGNPYQSYLSFSSFASGNASLWSDRGDTEPTYAVYDADMGGYIQYKEGTSRGAKAASGTINMHQGFLIRTASSATVTFTNNMRSNDGTGVHFRENQPAYPLINLTVTDDEGVNDFAVLELGRDTDEGAEKLRAKDSKGWLYLH